MGNAPDDDFQVALHDQLSGSSGQYLVQAFLGEGAFGKVAKCLKLGTDETVAVKILKKEPNVINDAREEVATLQILRDLNSDKRNIVRWHEYLMHKGHPCLVFELLDMNLFDYLTQRQIPWLSLKEIWPIIQQMATAFKELKRIGLIHGDLKPENIMVVDVVHQPIRVKLIDFGLAIPSSTARRCSTFQTMHWRAPEILLGLPFNEAIDMWSLGCVMADCFLGRPRFPWKNEYDMVRFIFHTLGEPEDHVLTAGAKTSLFFTVRDRLWVLKTPEEYENDTGIQPSSRSTRPLVNSLDELKQFDRGVTDTAEDLLAFEDLIKRMLQLDAAERITPSEALKHRFITMNCTDSCHRSTGALP